MNTIAPSPLSLPIYPDQPTTRPVAPVVASSSEFGDASQKSPTYVYRGELLEAVADDRRYRPIYNLPLNPLQQRAVNAYNNVAHEQQTMGRILDGFI